MMNCYACQSSGAFQKESGSRKTVRACGSAPGFLLLDRHRFLSSSAQRALRDRLMSRGKNCLPTVSRQFLTRNYPRPNCILKCLPNCLSPTREGFLSSFKINPAVRVIARQVRGKNCLAAFFAPRHQSVSSGPLGGTGVAP